MEFSQAMDLALNAVPVKWTGWNSNVGTSDSGFILLVPIQFYKNKSYQWNDVIPDKSTKPDDFFNWQVWRDDWECFAGSDDIQANNWIEI